MWKFIFSSLLLVPLFCDSNIVSARQVEQIHLRMAFDDSGDRIHVFRGESDSPILTQTAKPDFRPYIHPIVAPDGKRVLTQALFHGRNDLTG